MKFKKNTQVKFRDKYNFEIVGKIKNVYTIDPIFGTMYNVIDENKDYHIVPELKLLLMNEKYTKDYKSIFSKKWIMSEIKKGNIVL